MDNLNIQIYKDGNDLIVVFKNADKTIEDIATSMLAGIAIKEIPELTPPPEQPMVKPEKFEEYEEIVPEFLADDYVDEVVEPESDEDPATITNFVEFVSLYTRIKLGNAKDPDVCTALLKEYKKNNPNDFGKTSCSTLEKPDLQKILENFQQFAPEATKKKLGCDLVEYIDKTSVGDIRYAIRGLMWYNMKL